MNVKELQIGDYVNYRGQIIVVTSLYDKGGSNEVGWSDREDVWVNADNVKPVRLTEEILQKNFPSPEEIVWWPLKDGSFRVEMQDDTHLIIGKYNYVHELQHALRLFGKNGEIDMDKEKGKRVHLL